MMKTTPFGALNAQPVYAHTITSDTVSVTLIDYGARIQSLSVGERQIVCGFSDMAGYLADKDYHGATVGRYANRISDGKFTLNGKTYTLFQNESDKNCHLHGGRIGFSSRLWTPLRTGNNSLTYSLFSPDGEEGYPGNLTVEVTYTLKQNALTIDYTAVSDADTVINLTNHAYFNLDGVEADSILGHTLTLYADAIAEIDHRLIPSGRLLPTENTPFDFTVPKTIGRDIAQNHPQLENAGGYDHGFRLFQKRPAARLSSQSSDITVEIDTTEDALQIYTANFMTAEHPFFDTVPQRKNGAIAIEAGCLPDSPNRTEFPSPILKAGETYRQTTTYRFYQNNE